MGFLLLGILLAIAVVVASELTGWWDVPADCRPVFDGSAYGARLAHDR